ncbi:MAG: hypothetical protein ACTTIC_00005 [Helicobacteraceae bacterium]
METMRLVAAAIPVIAIWSFALFGLKVVHDIKKASEEDKKQSNLKDPSPRPE